MNAVHDMESFFPLAGAVRQTQKQAVSQFRRRVVALVLICTLPTAVLLAAGRLQLAADCFWAVFLAIVGALILFRRHETLLSLIIGVIPWLSLLRGSGFMFYNVNAVVLAVGALHYLVRAPQVVVATGRGCRLAVCLIVGAGIYYALSLARTGDYARNLRMFEFGLAVWCVLLAGRNRFVLGSGLLGLIFAAVAAGLALLPHNGLIGRLGIAVIEGSVVGNPVQLGMALALVCLAMLVDRGHWLAWIEARWWNGCWLVIAAILLVLTTSRAAWLVTSCGLLLTAMFGRNQRVRSVLLAGMVPVCVLVALAGPFGTGLRDGLHRTFSEERDMTGRTSGRSDQWRVAGRAVTMSPLRLLCGYGPGTGPTVYAKASDEVADVRYAVGRKAEWHSLFLQVLVETGLVGLTFLVVWLAVAFARVVAGLRRTGRLLPLVCFSGYVLTILTVSGNDTIAGTMLGIALLGAGSRHAQG